MRPLAISDARVGPRLAGFLDRRVATSLDELPPSISTGNARKRRRSDRPRRHPTERPRALPESSAPRPPRRHQAAGSTCSGTARHTTSLPRECAEDWAGRRTRTAHASHPARRRERSCRVPPVLRPTDLAPRRRGSRARRFPLRPRRRGSSQSQGIRSRAVAVSRRLRARARSAPADPRAAAPNARPSPAARSAATRGHGFPARSARRRSRRRPP